LNKLSQLIQIIMVGNDIHVHVVFFREDMKYLETKLPRYLINKREMRIPH